MNYKIEKIGKGNPKVAVVGCTHGDEIIGKLVIEKLKNLKLKQGQLTLVTANCEALKRNQRYIDQDLNRSFPGKEGGWLEESIAFTLRQILKPQDAVLDVHATNSDFKELVILHHLNSTTKKILKYLPIKKAAQVNKNIYEGKSLLHCCRNAVCLEFGPDKTGRNYKRALSRVKQYLVNMKMLPGQQKFSTKKEFYRVKDEYQVDQSFVQAKTLKDFQKIKKGQYLGSSNGQKLYSDKEFYPIFLGEGRYQGTLALMAEKQKLNL